MNRMRALAIKSSRKLARPVAGARKWWRAVRTSPHVPLDTVRHRLELLLAATYGVRFEVAQVANDTPRNTFHVHRQRPIARHDGVSILLPATMDAGDGEAAAIARYRLLAMEQAVRIIRRSAALAPTDGDAMARDLYNLREGAEIDASIVANSPGVAPLIAEERRRAIAARPALSRLSARERAVERLVRAVLVSDPAVVPDKVHGAASPRDSLAWTRERVAAMTSLPGRYRPLPPIGVWGQTLDSAGDVAARGPQYGALVPPSPGYGSGESAAPSAGADDTLQELSPTGLDAAKLPDNRVAPDDPDQATAVGDAGISSDGDPGEGGNGLKRARALNTTDASILAMSRAGGILYPEWDCNASAYRELGAVVHAQRAPEGDAAWADHVLGEHPALVRRVRREFERLKARRVRMLRQREGDELDLAAVVRALADATAGDSSDERLYMSVRAARRAIAIAVLVDVSGSTRDMIGDGRRVIDVEKTTLLLASEAFDALGDAYSILTFSGVGAPDVRVATLKSFAESNSQPVRRRIAGIEAGGNTRLGAAIRHATTVLAAQPAGHRLLLILSDGKPNDVDRYFTTYAVEDSRQAVFEARADGIYPFCLTIDAKDPDPYLARVFGAAGHTILRNAEQLPVALLDLVRELLRGGGR